MRVLDLVAKMEDGSWKSLACGEDATKICELRQKIIDAGGLIVSGRGKDKEEVKLTELRILANNTSGGEFKMARKFKA